MREQVHMTVWIIVAVALFAAAASAADWPSSLSYSVGLSSDEDSRLQLSASVQGPLRPHVGAKLGGWWVAASENNRAFVGEAYLDYTGREAYLAAGRKFVPFGPAGLLVSPGIGGGHGRYRRERLTLEALAGTLQFTPVTGGTRFTFAGSRAPAEESIRAARAAFSLSSSTPVVVGVNWLDLLDDTGASLDASVEARPWLSVFGESAHFSGTSAHVVGVRLTNQPLVRDPRRYDLLTVYHRRVPVGFLPAQVGATNYFENQTGWAVGLYHQFDAEHGLGLYADKEDVILTLFGYVPLR